MINSPRAGRPIPDVLQRELVRLDLTHLVMIKTVGEEQFLAPIDENKVHRVLDIGTGTGICGFFSSVWDWIEITADMCRGDGVWRDVPRDGGKHSAYTYVLLRCEDD